MQRRGPQPPMPPGKTNARMGSDTAQTRLAPMDHPHRADLHPGTLALHRITTRARLTGRRGRPLPGVAGDIASEADRRRVPAPARAEACGRAWIGWSGVANMRNFGNGFFAVGE